jgi:hypothetical protein
MADQKPVHGIFCWNELVTRDIDKAVKFYSDLVGWEITDSGMPGMQYNVAKVGDQQVAGLMAMPAEIPAQVPSHWMAYITVDDVDAAAAKVKELGGQLMYGPVDIAKVGRFCTIQDPTGGVVSLIQFPQK